MTLVEDFVGLIAYQQRLRHSRPNPAWFDREHIAAAWNRVKLVDSYCPLYGVDSLSRIVVSLAGPEEFQALLIAPRKFNLPGGHRQFLSLFCDADRLR